MTKTICGELLFDHGYWYLVADEGIFHITSNHHKGLVEGKSFTAEVEFIKGYSDVDGRTN